ncbi:MAG TPA: FAD-dependent oxidoreductase [Gemmatimonadaceae bacterium]|nr:FAD-dependent oxidoreductase [Gemmatimonadaceae bacterium]
MTKDDDSKNTLDRRSFLKVAGAQTGLLVAAASSAKAIARQPTARRAPAVIGRKSPDIAVIGAGAFGGWTAYHLRKMGARVTLIDTWGPGNSRSTSGEETRGVRSSYGDRPHGVLWARWATQAMERWKAWDEEFSRTKERVFYTTGDLIFRKDWEPFMKDTRKNWDTVGVRYEVLEPNDVRSHYPQIDLQGIGAILYEPAAGVVRARRSCERVAESFQHNGGKMVVARALPSLANGDRLQDIALSSGETLQAEKFVFACGPWLWKLFPEFLRTRLRTPMGNVYYYGTPIGDNRWVAPNMPSFNFPGITGWPALPNDARGFRVRVGGGTQTDPDTSQRWIDPSNFSRPRQFLIDRFPLLIDAPLLETRSCHYELSVTRNFYIDTHPEWSNVWIAGGGSAEGFKFGPVVGDYTARRVMGIEGDPAIAKAFRIPKEEFEEPPRTAADSARVKARADSVAKMKADSAKADSAKRVIPEQHAPAPKPDAPAKRPSLR